MAWTVVYLNSTKRQLRKMDPQVRDRILRFMGDRVAGLAHPHVIGRALTGVWQGYCDIEWVTTELSARSEVKNCWLWSQRPVIAVMCTTVVQRTGPRVEAPEMSKPFAGQSFLKLRTVWIAA